MDEEYFFAFTCFVGLITIIITWLEVLRMLVRIAFEVYVRM